MKKLLKYFLISTISIFLFDFDAEAKKTIAVLPFDVLSKNPEYEQFGVGTMDSITVSLVSIPEFVMVNRNKLNSVMKEQGFQNSGFSDIKNSVQIGKLLGAEILVMGTIQSFDNKFRITTSFIDVKTGKILQASKVTGSNIFDLQDQLADQLLHLENVKVTEEKREEITKITKSTGNNIAFDYYTRGRTEYYKIIEILINNKQASEREQFEVLNKSIEYFDKATEIDKGYSLAFASKAETQALLSGFYTYSETYKDVNKSKEYLQKADETSQYALKLSNKSGFVYKSLAFVSYMKSDSMDRTIDYSLKSIEYNPEDKEANLWIAMTYYREANKAFKNKDFDKSIIYGEKSVQYLPNFTNAYYYLGISYYAKKELNKSIVNFETALEIYPNNEKVIVELLKVYQDKADEYYKKSDFVNLEKIYISMIKYNDKSSDLYNNLAIAYFMQKKYDLSQQMYEKAINLKPDNGSFYDNLGLLFETRGDKEKAGLNYKKACELGYKASCR